MGKLIKWKSQKLKTSAVQKLSVKKVNDTLHTERKYS